MSDNTKTVEYSVLEPMNPIQREKLLASIAVDGKYTITHHGIKWVFLTYSLQGAEGTHNGHLGSTLQSPPVHVKDFSPSQLTVITYLVCHLQ